MYNATETVTANGNVITCVRQNSATWCCVHWAQFKESNKNEENEASNGRTTLATPDRMECEHVRELKFDQMVWLNERIRSAATQSGIRSSSRVRSFVLVSAFCLDYFKFSLRKIVLLSGCAFISIALHTHFQLNSRNFLDRVVLDTKSRWTFHFFGDFRRSLKTDFPFIYENTKRFPSLNNKDNFMCFSKEVEKNTSL